MAEEKIDWIKFFKTYNKVLEQFQIETMNDTKNVSVDFLTYYLGEKVKAEFAKDNDSVQEETVVEKQPKEKEQGFLSKLWNKTVFPDKIKEAKEEKALKRKIKKEARQQAMKDIQPELAKHYKEKELDKLTGKSKQDKLQKLVDGFNMGNLGSTDKLNTMLGQQPQQQQYQQPQQQGRYGPSNADLANMMGGGPAQQPQQQNKKKGIGRGWNTEDKLKQMLR